MNLTNIQLNNQKKILIVIFLILIIYVDSGYILKAQRAGLKSLSLQITKLNTDLVNLNRGLENMRMSQSNPGLATQKKMPKPTKILTESQISELLQDISAVANKFDIKITQMRPSRQVQKDKSTVSQEKLIPMLINLDLVADYHNFGRFIQALENYPVFMGVLQMEISTQLPDYLKQKVNLVLQTYVTR